MVRVGHHCNEHVEQHGDVAHRVRTKHQLRPELGELLNAGQLEVGETDKAEASPEQGLHCLEEVVEAFPYETGGSAILCLLLITLPKNQILN